MAIVETLLFIRKPFAELERSALRMNAVAIDRSDEGNESTVLFDSRSEDGIFGFSQDRDAPEGGAWSHLLAEDATPQRIAALLNRLRISADHMEAATDWSGHPLVDIEAVRRLLSSRPVIATAAAGARRS